jgi:hypothetical protein
MPTLPASGYPTPTAPSIEPSPSAGTPFQDIRAPVEAFGGASAAALRDIGTSFEKASNSWEHITNEFDKVSALDARTKADLAANTVLYGNPEDSTSTGYFGLEGKSKLEARPETIKSLRTIYDDAGKGLSPNAKRLYDESTRGHRLGVEANIALDSVRALAQYREQADKGTIKLAEQNADRLALTDDLEAWNVSVGEGVQRIQAVGERANKPPEVIEAEKNAFRAGRIVEKAGALAERDPEASMRFLDNNRRFFSDPSTFEHIYGVAKAKAEAKQVDQLASPGGAGASTKSGPGTLSVPEMVALAEQAGFKGEAARTIAAIARSESGGDPDAHNSVYPDDSYGITQINALAHGDKAKAAKGNPLRAMELAFEVSKGGTDFSPWTEYRNKGYQKYLGEATRGPTTAGTAVSITGQDGKSYNLTQAEAQQYYSIKDFEAQQKFLTERPTPTTTAPAPTDLASEIARINASGASQEVKDKAIAKVNARYSQERNVWEQNEDSLRRRIRDGDAAITEPYLDAEMDAGRIGPSQRQAVEAYRKEVLKGQKEKSDNLALVFGATSGGAPLDPQNSVHKKAVNEHFDELSKGVWPIGTSPSPEVWNSAINYTIKLGMMPERVRSTIRGGLHSGRPDLALRAVETINTLRNVNPQLITDLGDENDMRLATLIGTYAGSGMAPEQAVERANEALKVGKPEREARAADYDLQRGKEPKDRTASDDKWIASQQNSIWVRDPDIDPMMRTEFAETAKAEFQRTGNLEASRRMALDTVNRVWGRSEVGGDRRYVKQAPEKFYSIPTLTPAENSRWMNEQLLSDVGKGALQDPSNPITSDRLRLIPDPTRTNGGNPVYQVWLVQPNKGWEQVVDVKGAPIRWHPDYSTSADRKRRDDAAAAEIEKARTLRREQGEREQMVPDPRRYRTGP